MRKIAHLSRDFEASVTLCPICKNYLVHERKKVLQGEKTQQQRSGKMNPLNTAAMLSHGRRTPCNM
jgi:hypothetical protein